MSSIVTQVTNVDAASLRVSREFFARASGPTHLTQRLRMTALREPSQGRHFSAVTISALMFRSIIARAAAPSSASMWATASLGTITS